MKYHKDDTCQWSLLEDMKLSEALKITWALCLRHEAEYALTRQWTDAYQREAKRGNENVW